MKYYFEIKTTNQDWSGTNSNFTIRFWGEKGQGDTFELFSAIGKRKVNNGECLRLSGQYRDQQATGMQKL